MSDLRERISRELEHAFDTKFEVLDAVEIASHGGDWEPESAAALYRIGDEPALYLSFAIDKSGDPETLLGERVQYYRQLADGTERLLQRYRELQVDAVLAPVPDVPPEAGDELPDDDRITAQRLNDACTRLVELAGLHDEEIEDRVAGIHLVPGPVPEDRVDAYVRAGSLLFLALNKHGAAPADPELKSAIEDVNGFLELWRSDEPVKAGTEELIAFGSGNVARDLGIPNPESVTFKWRLARILSSAMRDRSLDAGAVVELAGETTPPQIERITKGLVRDVDSYEIMRLLKSLGYRVVVDVLLPKNGFDGVVWLTEPGGYRYDEKAIEMLRAMEPRKKR